MCFIASKGKTLIYFNTEIDKNIADANLDATLFALNFNNVLFNRTGEFTFQTRALGHYIFSDVALTFPEEIGDMEYPHDLAYPLRAIKQFSYR